MEKYEFGDRMSDTALIFPCGDADADSIGRVTGYIEKNTGIPFSLTAFKIEDWNRDLSPWEAPAVFGNESFGGGAEHTLDEILGYCTDESKTYLVGGYSLAGLFALWAAHKTDIFSGVAAASPSVWFPGFTDLMRNEKIRCGAVYLSLGDREEKTRNPVMASVGQKIRDAYSILNESGISCVLEWNEGNHFKDTDIRTAKAFVWLMSHVKKG